MSEPEIDGETALLLLAPTIRVGTGERAHETRLSVVHVAGGGDEVHGRSVGGERGDASRLRGSSPLRRASEIRAPVLLGHGEDDQRVHVRQSRRMAEALRTAGKQVEYLEFPKEVHGFLLEANRVRWYGRVAAFFEEHLAPRAPSATAR